MVKAVNPADRPRPAVGIDGSPELQMMAEVIAAKYEEWGYSVPEALLKRPARQSSV
jgi:hypothetical protein